jgi:hypothetical protein
MTMTPKDVNQILQLEDYLEYCCSNIGQTASHLDEPDGSNLEVWVEQVRWANEQIFRLVDKEKSRPLPSS